jgi:hypothetical protein
MTGEQSGWNPMVPISSIYVSLLEMMLRGRITEKISLSAARMRYSQS